MPAPSRRLPPRAAVLLLSACAALAACGDLPRPFAGNPGRTALRLAAPPPAELAVPAPSSAMLSAADATALSRSLAEALVAREVPAFARPPQPGDWRLETGAELGGGAVTPMLRLRDAAGTPKGEAKLPAIGAARWAAGGPQLVAAVVAAAAPRAVDLLRSVDAAIKQSDPNSLYNRPARLFVAPVTGAPGDGNIVLRQQMAAHLPDTGDVVTETLAEADFTVRGRVSVTDAAGGQQTVELHWKVIDARGRETGDVAQIHDVPKGLLAAHWGEVAGAAAAEAAGGVHQVVTNAIGRTGSGAPKAEKRPSPPAGS